MIRMFIISIMLIFSSISLAAQGYEKMIEKYCNALGYQFTRSTNSESCKVLLPNGDLVNGADFFLPY